MVQPLTHLPITERLQRCQNQAAAAECDRELEVPTPPARGRDSQRQHDAGNCRICYFHSMYRQLPVLGAQLVLAEHKMNFSVLLPALEIATGVRRGLPVSLVVPRHRPKLNTCREGAPVCSSPALCDSKN